MFCDACGGSFATYYRMGQLNVCQGCIENTYVYQRLIQGNPLKNDTQKLSSFVLSPRCGEYDSICSERERFLEKIYFDIDRLIWEIDTDKFERRKKRISILDVNGCAE